MRLKHNDKLLLTWVDICEEGNDPAKADLGTWDTLCYFIRLDRKRDTPVIIVRTSCDIDEKNGEMHHQSGSLCIPTACIKRIRRLTLGKQISLACLGADDTQPHP